MNQMRIYFTFFLLISSCWSLVEASNHSIDSLKNVLVEQSPDSLKMKIYRDLCHEYRVVNVDSSFYFYKLSLEIAQKEKWQKEESLTISTMGYIYLRQGSLIESESYFINAMNICRTLKDTTMMAEVSNALGLVNWKLNRNDKAIKHFQKAYDYGLESGNDEVITFALSNLGMISSDNERYDEAIIYFEKSGVLAKKNGNQDGEILAILNIAVINKILGKYTLALKEFREAIKILDPTLEYSNISRIYFNIAEILRDQKKYNEAIDNVDKSLQISRDKQMKDIEATCLHIKAKILIELGKYKQAILNATQALQLSIEIGVEDITAYQKTLATAFEKNGNYKEALNWQKNYSILQDSLHKLGRENEISALEISFQTKQKDIENASLKKEKKSQQLLILQRTRIAMGTGVVVLLLLAVAFLLYQARSKARSMNNVLEVKVKERTEALEILNTQLLRSNAELKRFAFIASHDLKEPLRNVGGFISLIKRRLKHQGDQELLEYIEFVTRSNYQMVELVDNILEYSKIESKEKMEMEVINLKNEIDDICSLLLGTNEGQQIQINYPNLPNIYFNKSVIKVVLKNLIENGLRYNKEHNPLIDVSYRIEGKIFKLLVKDNGLGIAPEFQHKIFEMFVRLHNRSEYKGSGMGLAFCKKMLDNNGGDISVESEEGVGSTFIVSIPAEIVREDVEPALAF